MDHDQNWRWPEKTWFRERLNAVKAREHEQQRRTPVGRAEKPSTQASETHDSDKEDLKVD